MKPLKLYKVEPQDRAALFIAARSNRQAAEIHVTVEAAQGLSRSSFAVELVRMESLDTDQQLQLRSLLPRSTEGIAHFDATEGWSINSEGLTSFDSGEEVQ